MLTDALGDWGTFALLVSLVANVLLVTELVERHLYSSTPDQTSKD